MASLPKDISIRPSTKEDYSQLAELYLACFGLRVGSDFFHWKYDDNPAGQAASVCAVSGEKLCAYYALLPEHFVGKGKELKVYQSMDTMTHPDFQRLGLFSSTANACFDSVVSREGSLRMYGIPGFRALPGFKKLGWKHAHDFDLLFQHSLLVPTRAGHACRVLSENDPLWAGYFEEHEPPPGLSQKLSKKIVDWSVYRHPLTKFEVLGMIRNERLEGFVVTRAAGASRRLVALIDSRSSLDRPRVAANLLGGLAARHRGSWLYAWEPTEPGLAGAFRSSRFIKNPFHRGPFSHRVPLILRAMGSAEAEWEMPAAGDWQAYYQD